jgi:GWxTD domain-containing protein
MLGAALAVAAAPASAEQTGGEIAVRTVRLYRAAANRTRIKAFVEIPYDMLASGAASGAKELAYKVAVTLNDSTGLTLLHQEWWGHAPAELQGPGASTVEILDFAVAPGAYRLNVAVTDSVSGRSQQVSNDLRSFDMAPPMSDLWLAPRMRLVSPTDTVPGLGELREGTTLVTAAARPVLTPLRSTLYYLAEVYRGSSQPGTMRTAVTDSTGTTIVRSEPTAYRAAEDGGILSGQVDLTGLPAGRYVMNLELISGTDTITRSADFVMKGLEETLQRNLAEREARRVTDEGYFAAMNANQLDEAEAPLYYVAPPGELSAYRKDLSLNAKRRFLTTFWSSHDPTPGTPRNEARERFYNGIAEANRRFTEGGRRPVPGWKSDRGRIYARYGEPDDRLERQQEGTAPRYQVWRYTRERSRYYVFADRTGFGTFVLLATNDTKEPSLPNWTDMLGFPAMQDIQQFLGINFLVQ